VKTAQQAHTDTTLIMARMFTAPKPWKLAPALLLACIVAGALVRPTLQGVLNWGVIVYGLPAFVGALLTKPLAELLGGKTYLRRTFLLSLVSQFLIIGVAGVAAILRLFNVPVPSDRIALLSLSSAVWVRHVVLSSTSQSHLGRSLPAILAQPVMAIALVFVVAPAAVRTWENGILAAFLVAVFLITAIAFTEVANRPLKKSFGVSGLRMMRHFLDHMTELNGEGQHEIEEFFATFSTPFSVRVAAIGFRTPKGTKAAIVAPSVHPGPFGTAGGSDLPLKVKRVLQDLTPNVLVPHAPTTHDQNPATTGDVRKLAAKAREILASGGLSPTGSPMVRVQSGQATATAQMFGRTAFITASMAPNPTDDIDAATGYSVLLAAKEAGAEDALFVDAHNSLTVGAGWAVFGTPQSRDIIEAAKGAVLAAARSAPAAVRVGYAEHPLPGKLEQGLGDLGIQVLAVETAGQRAAYLVIDGNNMVPGLREKIRDALRGLVAECEVLTTDNHSVNVALGGFNPVGARFDHAAIVSMAVAAVKEALQDLELVEVRAGSGQVDEILLWGHESTTRLSTGINSTVSILRITASVSLSLAFSLAVLALVLTS